MDLQGSCCGSWRRRGKPDRGKATDQAANPLLDRLITSRARLRNSSALSSTSRRASRDQGVQGAGKSANQRGRLIAQRCHQSVTFPLHDKCCVVGRSSGSAHPDQTSAPLRRGFLCVAGRDELIVARPGGGLGPESHPNGPDPKVYRDHGVSGAKGRDERRNSIGCVATPLSGSSTRSAGGAPHTSTTIAETPGEPHRQFSGKLAGRD